MFIQCITGTSYSIYVDRNELTARHLSADTLTCSDAVCICRDAIGTLPEETCLELYPGKDGILIFARSFDGVSWYSFSSLNDLTEAAAVCREDVLSSLYRCDGSYILSVVGSAPHLCEYGEPLYPAPAFRLYLEEHGKCLTDRNALELLKKIG